jgi:alkanesulfonate monooxygenase SsuD/methylene tetrahydromethanopterin reductase-like flavin-dependent oxidoreductase (luciferase family)
MTDVNLGVLLWSQAASWSETRDAARRIDGLGYEHLWTWDHLYAIYGDPYQPIFEGWTLLGALARETERIRLGLLVGANSFRNPGLTAKAAATLDHVSDGRAILGIGGAWFELEHDAHGIDFGSGFGERLDWLDEAAGAMRSLLDGGTVTSEAGGRYAFVDLRHAPPPIQAHLPIMIGGGGEKKTLRTVAKYADMWNGFGTAETLARKLRILGEHCAAVGRDEREIERSVGCKIVIRDSEAAARRVWADQMAHNRTPEAEWDGPETAWIGTPAQVAAEIRNRVEVGIETVIVELPAPFDVETIERFIGEVKPLVDAG